MPPVPHPSTISSTPVGPVSKGWAASVAALFSLGVVVATRAGAGPRVLHNPDLRISSHQALQASPRGSGMDIYSSLLDVAVKA
jgi:hypothetical protein